MNTLAENNAVASGTNVKIGRSEDVKKRIFVVDDDYLVLDFLNQLLSEDGFEIVCANESKDTFDLMKSDSSQRFDLVIMDLIMQGQDGFSIIKELQRVGYQNVPILVLTGRLLDAAAIEMIRNESNVCEFYQKPLDIVEFRNVIHSLLNLTGPII